MHVEALDVVLIVVASLLLALTATVHPSRSARVSCPSTPSGTNERGARGRGLRKVYLGGDGQPSRSSPTWISTCPRESSSRSSARAGPARAPCCTCSAPSTTDRGNVQLDGRDYATLPPTELAYLRNRSIGFVFQFHHLLREFTALENVAMPLRIAGMAADAARRRAEELLPGRAGGRLNHRPAAVVGRRTAARGRGPGPGERSPCRAGRRALGQSGPHPAGELHELLAVAGTDFETALVVVTHNRHLAERADRVLSLEDGRLVPPRVEAMS